MVNVNDYARQRLLLHGLIFIGASLASLPIWIAISQLEGSDKLLSALHALDWIFPKLPGDVAKMRARSAVPYLEGSYYLAHLLFVIILPLYLYWVFRDTASGIDFSNPSKWRLKAEALWVQVGGAFVLALTIALFGAENMDIPSKPGSVVESPMVLVWTGLLFAALADVAVNARLSWQNRKWERSQTQTYQRKQNRT